MHFINQVSIFFMLHSFAHLMSVANYVSSSTSLYSNPSDYSITYAAYATNSAANHNERIVQSLIYVFKKKISGVSEDSEDLINSGKQFKLTVRQS